METDVAFEESGQLVDAGRDKLIVVRCTGCQDSTSYLASSRRGPKQAEKWQWKHTCR
jgi:hypothetical protein